MSSAFQDLVKQINKTKLPPVDTWHPERQGEIDIRIRRDGVWFHEGSEIRRKSIAKVLSTVLKREFDEHYLVTPGEKLRIEVDDVAFTAVDFEAMGSGRDQQIVFKTNLDDVVLLDADHRLLVGHNLKYGFTPYLHVRNGLHARLLNDVFYRLADYVECAEADPLVIWSAGERFVVSGVE